MAVNGWIVALFLAIAASNALADRLGIQSFGFAPMIIPPEVHG